MTTDNHPLTPRPVDDREAEFQVTQADREAAESVILAHWGRLNSMSRRAFSIRAGDCDHDVFVQAFARHREQAERGLREALRPFAECAEQISDDEDDEEWAKFRLLIKDYRAARKALDTRP